MKPKNIAVAVAAFLPALIASLPADAEPMRPVVQQQQPIAKLKTELALANVSAVPGEKKTIDVTLADPTGKPVADKLVQLEVVAKAGGPALAQPIVIGNVQTAANGHATFSWACADLKQGNFELQASFAGDANALASKGTANLLVVKAQAKIAFQEMTWGTYKDEPGAPYGTFIFTLTRTSDGKALDKPITISVNGKAWNITTSYGFAQIALMPQNAKSWDVKLQFDGDDYTIATGGEHKYVHP